MSHESKLILAQVNRNQTKIHSCLTKQRVTLIHDSYFWALIQTLSISKQESARTDKIMHCMQGGILDSVSLSPSLSISMHNKLPDKLRKRGCTAEEFCNRIGVTHAWGQNKKNTIALVSNKKLEKMPQNVKKPALFHFVGGGFRDLLCLAHSPTDLQLPLPLQRQKGNKGG